MVDAKPAYRVAGKKVYRGYSQQELNVQYSARGTAPDGDKDRNFISDNSARVRDDSSELGCLAVSSSATRPWIPSTMGILDTYWLSLIDCGGQ